MTISNLLLVAGSGKKVGKTFLVTALIRKFAQQVQVIGLKISPHVHNDLGEAILITGDEKRFRIYRELNPHRKNSGQYLAAGASRSFFMETTDEHLPEAFACFCRLCNPENQPVICESGALGRIIKPGIIIYIKNSAAQDSEIKSDMQQHANLVLEARAFDPSSIASRICLADNAWQISGT